MRYSLLAGQSRSMLFVLAYVACCIGFIAASWFSGYLDYSWLFLFPITTAMALIALELRFREGFKNYFLMGAMVTFQTPFLFFISFDAIYSTQVLLDKNNCSANYSSQLGTQWCDELIAQVTEKQVRYATLLGFGYIGLLVVCLLPAIKIAPFY